MCGICGVLNTNLTLRPSTLSGLVKRMANLISHRGPDDEGSWVSKDGHCSLSHRRLSIIDTSSAGRQPMHSWDQRFTISFNGEIYNFAELRSDLEACGAKFNTRTDTEVLIEAYRLYGESVFSKLDGMYAFALYDNDTGETVIARDPFGEKPLYYTQQGGYIGFCSELHALTILPKFDDTVDFESVAQFFAFQYVPSPRTIYRSVKKLPPGHFMKVAKDGRIALHRYFSFEPLANPTESRSIDELADELEDILIKSIRRRLMSDVPLGAFLSGGVDSSTVVALITKTLGYSIKTFSIGFEDTPESEHVMAREMAKHLGSDHHEKILKPNVLPLSQHIATVLDEPNSDSSCLPTYLLSQFAREHVTVALSGDGGDEMFCGYSRYFHTLDEASKNQTNPSWNAGDAYFSDRIFIFAEPYLERLLGTIPPETKELIQSLKADINSRCRPLLSQLRQTDMNYYMPGAVLAKVDRMSMQHALEVRCPILSVDVARFAEKLTPSSCYREGQGKLVLKQVAARYIPREWLERTKKGFGLPTNLWGRKMFLKQLRAQALSYGAMTQRWIGRENVKRFVNDQEQPNQFSTYQVWSFLIFEQWLRTHAITSHVEKRSRLNIRDLFSFRGSGIQLTT